MNMIHTVVFFYQCKLTLYDSKIKISKSQVRLGAYLRDAVYLRDRSYIRDISYFYTSFVKILKKLLRMRLILYFLTHSIFREYCPCSTRKFGICWFRVFSLKSLGFAGMSLLSLLRFSLER